MKKPLSILLVLCLLSVFAGVGVAYYWWQTQLQPVGSDSSTINFVVQPTEGAGSIIANLTSQGLIKSALATRIYVKSTGLENKLRPGTYSLSPSLSTSEILALITSGPDDVRITIPEGWRREQIAARLAAALSPYNSPFDAQSFINSTASLEGQLYPETYHLPAHITTSEVIDLFTRNFQRFAGVDTNVSYQIKTGEESLTLSGLGVITLASLVEREARLDPDRPIIAGILLNRLNSGMILNVDATVQYAKDTQSMGTNLLSYKFWQPISDTQIPSLFNTYLYSGLPPHPICNPGRESINAVLQPQSTPYYYYLTGNDGRMYYAATLAEHNSNVDKYLKP